MATFLEGRIKTHLARKLAQNYKRNKLDNKLRKDDTTGVWFSIQTILTAAGVPEAEIPEIIKRCVNNDSGAPKNISGLRLYLGAYGKDHKEIPKKPRDREKLTIILVQTEEKGTGDALIHRDLLEDETANPSYEVVSVNENEPIVEFNDGQICPPYKKDEAVLLNKI